MITPMITTTDYSEKLTPGTSVSACVETIVTKMTPNVVPQVDLPHLTAAEYPILAEIWDNDDDAIFDTM